MLGVEIVNGFEDVRERGEEGEEDGEIKGYIATQEGDDGFGDEHMEGARERYGEEEVELRFSRREGCWWRRETKLLVPALDEGLLVGFACEARHEGGKEGEEY